MRETTGNSDCGRRSRSGGFGSVVNSIPAHQNQVDSLNDREAASSSEEEDDDFFVPELPPANAFFSPDTPTGSDSNDGGPGNMDQQFEEFLQQEAENPAFAACLHQDEESQAPDFEGRSIHTDDETVVSGMTMVSSASLFRGPLYQRPTELDPTDEDVANLFNRNIATERNRQPQRMPLHTHPPAAALTEKEDLKIKTSIDMSHSEKFMKDDKTAISLKKNASDTLQVSSSTHPSGSSQRRSLGDAMTNLDDSKLKRKGTQDKTAAQQFIADQEGYSMPELQRGISPWIDEVMAEVQSMPSSHSGPSGRSTHTPPGLLYDNRGRLLKSTAKSVSSSSTDGPGAYSGNSGREYGQVMEVPDYSSSLGASGQLAEEDVLTAARSRIGPQTTMKENDDNSSADSNGAAEKQSYKSIGVMAMALLLIVVLAIVIPVAVLQSNPSEDPPMVDQNQADGGTNNNEIDLSLVPNISNRTIQALADPHSQQYQAYDLISMDPNWGTYEDWRKQQRFAVACFLYAFGGNSFTSFGASFHPRNGAHECDWIAGSDTCNGQNFGKVTVLRLSQARGKGAEMVWPMPSELSFLKHLEILDLSIVKLRPSLEELLPTETLRSMPPSLRELRLQKCQLKGSIPSAFGLLTSITHLDLSGNSLSSTIPTEIGLLSNLTSLVFSGTSLSGSIPKELSSVPNLEQLALTGTSLTGSIPDGVCDVMVREEEDCLKLSDTTTVCQPRWTNASVCEGTALCGCSCVEC